ncbi:MAG: DUF2782 domain-containing protein [Methylophilaceae bacterium]|nr:DUF2782 domain-containing protein [Methylophilaceae bacterium]
MKFKYLLQPLSLLLALLALSGMALAAEKPVFPDNLEPLPDALPPPGATDADIEEPQVTILKKGDDEVEEYRLHGELYMMKITPSHGVPYYLMREDQDGGWSRMDGPTPPPVIPKWILFRF